MPVINAFDGQKQAVVVPIEASIEHAVSFSWAMGVMSREELKFLATNTNLITDSKEYDGAYIWDKITNIGEPGKDSILLAGILLHEAQHHLDYSLCLPAGGIEAESKAIDRMVAFYARKGRQELVDHYNSAKGLHGTGFNPNDYTKGGC